MSDPFAANQLLSWGEILKFSKSDSLLERKEALQMARVRAMEHLKSLGLRARKGAAGALIKQGIEQGHVDQARGAAGLDALEVRNDLFYYKGKQVSVEETHAAAWSLFALCNPDEATKTAITPEQRARAHQVNNLTLEERADEIEAQVALAALIEKMFAVAAAAAVVAVAVPAAIATIEGAAKVTGAALDGVTGCLKSVAIGMLIIAAFAILLHYL